MYMYYLLKDKNHCNYCQEYSLTNIDFVVMTNDKNLEE